MKSRPFSFILRASVAPWLIQVLILPLRHRPTEESQKPPMDADQRAHTESAWGDRERIKKLLPRP